ncbi:MAG: hypothetical protein ACTSQE_08525 [Candidatus Heimdallarchaeaceae archaeon]
MTKKDLTKWGSTLAIIGGVIWLVVGVLMLIGNLLESIVNIFNMASYGGNLFGVTMHAIILIVIGAITILMSIGRFELKETAQGIFLIVFGIIGSGLPGLLVIIGGILFIIAGF